MTAVAKPNPKVDDRRAEGMATYLCNIFMEYCRFAGISTQDLIDRTGINKNTIRGLRHKKVRNYPQLLTFVKLLAAADLELQIVRVQHGMLPDDPTEDDAPPPTYNTGTEGDLRW